jgi:hypothetical protein
MLPHRREIAIVMQKRAAAFDAKGADDDVIRFADRYALISQRAIVSRDARREITVEKGYDLEAAQTALDARRVKFIPRALKNFEQNEIADKDQLICHRGPEFRGRWR